MFKPEAESDREPYETPRICDYGDLGDITRACFGGGGEDGGAKANGNPFVQSQPYFGDSGDFCSVPS